MSSTPGNDTYHAQTGAGHGTSAVTVTFFADQFAATKREEQVSLATLARRIKITTKAKKSQLPWVKCAIFGDIRTDKNSLRHDGNVLAITGIEADYDAKLISFGEAERVLTAAGINGILYTSPSHTEDEPKWRVLCPLSHKYPPDRRDVFMARLSGVFGGVFDPVSWTLSQSYYAGSVNRNPSHRVVMIDGDRIDLRDDLDATAIGRPEKSKPNGPNGGGAPTPPEAITDKRIDGLMQSLLDNVRVARKPNKRRAIIDNGRSIGGYLRHTPWSAAEAAAQSVEALDHTPGEVEDWEAAKTLAAWAIAAGMKEPLDLEDRPDPRGPRNPPPIDPPGPGPGPLPPDEVAAELEYFNSRYFVVNENGKTIIYAPRCDHILNNRKFFERHTFDDFGNLYANRSILIGNRKRLSAKWWIRHPNRRQYIGGIVFDPASRHNDPDVLNLWDGFAVVPQPGSWALLQDHIRDVICGGDLTVFAYILDWMADLVQNPGKQGEVSVVLRGKEGCGKGTVANALKHLFGQHGLAISNARHLVGNFNSHLRNVVFLFADEAFYAGDKQHVGVLKALITESELVIEGKYQNAVRTPNFLHVMMASNEGWVVPAGLESRRWLMLDVLGDKIGDHAYFAAIGEELKQGGHAAMLHALLNRDISASNLRAVPRTEALLVQRELSLDTTTRWWLDCLHRSYVFESKLGLEDYWQQWHIFLPTDVLFASYERYCQAHRERHPLTRPLFGKWMTESGAIGGKMRKQAVGEHIVEAFSDGRSSRVTELNIKDHPHGYTLGTLAEVRERFAEKSGLEIEWEA